MATKCPTCGSSEVHETNQVQRMIPDQKIYRCGNCYHIWDNITPDIGSRSLTGVVPLRAAELHLMDGLPISGEAGIQMKLRFVGRIWFDRDGRYGHLDLSEAPCPYCGQRLVVKLTAPIITNTEDLEEVLDSIWLEVHKQSPTPAEIQKELRRDAHEQVR